MSDTPEVVDAAVTDAPDAAVTDAPADSAQAAEDTPEATEATPDTDQDTPEDDPGQEAARWRRKLRETEKVRDDLAARVEALQRQQVGRLLEGHNVKPEALYAAVELADLLGEDGTVDAEKLSAAVATVREKFGIVKTPKGTVVPGVGRQPLATPRLDRWSEAFKPRRAR